MLDITRRKSLLLGASALGGEIALGHRAAAETLAGVPVADINPPTLPVEKGAKLQVLRPAKFLDPDERWFRVNSHKFTEKTGVPVEVTFVSWDQVRPQTAVAAHAGAGPDIILGWKGDPQIFADKLVDVTDLAGYLGAKYGGWYDLSVLYGSRWGTGGKEWIAIPVGGSTGPTVYRESWVKEAGFEEIPNDLDKFLTLCQRLKKNGHPSGFSLGAADVGDAPAFCRWLLWSHGGYAIDEQGKVALDSKETLDAVNYCKELYPTMIPGVLSWNSASNNQAYLAGELSLTFNGVSIYYVCKNSKDKRLNEIAADTNNVLPPFGASKEHAPEVTLVINAMVFRYSKYPNAAKEYLRFMMEAPQYGSWLANCYGYWSQPLRAYGKMAFWDADPKIAAYNRGMDTPYYDGYKGPIGTNSSSISANHVLVDMFGKVATGNSSAKDAVRSAVDQLKRLYKD